ncbi:MAG: aminopeptidase P family protein [Rhodospirillales bacterium]|nr:aminopeptidase P family protein [Rhodospirillales bacterium]
MPSKKAKRPAKKTEAQIPEFKVDEYKGRVRRLQEEMDKAKLDAIFVTSEANFYYITGFFSPTWVNLTRPRYCVIPRTRDPIIVSPTTNLIIVERTSWVKDVRSWIAPRPADDGISILADALRSCLGKHNRIGAELGPESRMAMPIGDFLRLKEMLAPVEIADGDGLMRKLRLVKSEAEIARMDRIGQIASAAFDAFATKIDIGATERAATDKLRQDLIKRGADSSPYVTAQSGPGGYPCVNLAPSARVLKRGDLFTIDTGSTFDGYFCDFNRQWGLGNIPDAIRKAYEFTWRAAEAGIKVVRPGITMADVWRAQHDQYASENAPGGGKVQPTKLGRMGHGVGLHMCEPPSVHPDDKTVLVPGMTITIEPSMAYTVAGPKGPEARVLVTEENLVVTEDGAKLLTRRAPPELPIVR